MPYVSLQSDRMHSHSYILISLVKQSTSGAANILLMHQKVQTKVVKCEVKPNEVSVRIGSTTGISFSFPIHLPSLLEKQKKNKPAHPNNATEEIPQVKLLLQKSLVIACLSSGYPCKRRKISGTYTTFCLSKLKILCIVPYLWL